MSRAYFSPHAPVRHSAQPPHGGAARRGAALAPPGSAFPLGDSAAFNGSGAARGARPKDTERHRAGTQPCPAGPPGGGRRFSPPLPRV